MNTPEFPDFLKVTPTKHSKAPTLKKLEAGRAVAWKRLKARIIAEAKSKEGATSEGADGRAEARAADLPCPNSKDSIEADLRVLNQSAVKKRYFRHSQNLINFICSAPLERVAELTLTFKKKVYKRKVAEKMLNSLMTNFLRPRYGNDNIAVVRERHKDTAIHYHLVLLLDWDIRTEKNLEAALTGKDWMADDRLKREWFLLRRHLKRFDFGRHRLHPVKKCAKSYALYLCKYLTKTLWCELKDEYRGIAIRIPKKHQMCSDQFSWVIAEGYRRALGKIASVCCDYGLPVRDISDFKRFLGSKWGFHIRPLVEQIMTGISLWTIEYSVGMFLRKHWAWLEYASKLERDRAFWKGQNGQLVAECHLEALSDAGRDTGRI